MRSFEMIEASWPEVGDSAMTSKVAESRVVIGRKKGEQGSEC